MQIYLKQTLQLKQVLIFKIIKIDEKSNTANPKGSESPTKNPNRTGAVPGKNVRTVVKKKDQDEEFQEERTKKKNDYLTNYMRGLVKRCNDINTIITSIFF